ncbi:ArsB/NhaD family transporter [Anaeroselena agilis]|uniref:ArsB/NhaD family transporter n=1 Tax=Anaeroselena agilis TaxID=3063788 RepID=A0ABU3P367_9FIRM|nr:ArsB/NhaD family transporter [Selenomonadales bacterium 4137-cl]
MDKQVIFAVAVFITVYALIISEKIHRTVLAMVGGMLMVVFGILSQEQAIHHIDFNTIGLLVGMMIIVGVTAETGLFRYLAIWSAKKVGGDPVKLFIALGTLTAVCSALLDNVTTVLLTVPVTISITRQLEVPPIPYLVAQIIASNVGGTATLIGDPPNIMIGSAVKELSFMAFINNLFLIAFFMHFIVIALLAWFYRKKLVTTDELREKIMHLDETKQLTNIKLLKTCLAVLALTIFLFTTHQLFHLESATVALFGASILLLLTAKQSEHGLEHIFHKVEWVALFFFVGLFVLVGGLVETGVIKWLAQEAIKLTAGNITATSMLILWLSAIASAFVDNIPFVATMIPLIKDMGAMGITNLEPLWWSLALGACLGGNGTIIGASANIIVAGLAAQEGYNISFKGFFKVAFPVMLLTIVISTVYVYLRYLL